MPALAGVLISIAVLVLIVQPARQRVELETRVGDLQALQRRLSKLDGELDGDFVLSVVLSFSRVCWWI